VLPAVEGSSSSTAVQILSESAGKSNKEERMATYYTQDATVGTEVNRFYGAQTAHNHDTGTKFGQAIKAIMKLTYGATADIRLGHFAKDQSRIPTGGRRVVQLKWKSGDWSN
jgi:hypothetical protein